jgi:hypothetical protein
MTCVQPVGGTPDEKSSERTCAFVVLAKARATAKNRNDFRENSWVVGASLGAMMCRKHVSTTHDIRKWLFNSAKTMIFLVRTTNNDSAMLKGPNIPQRRFSPS